jgi:hypothetical protein
VVKFSRWTPLIKSLWCRAAEGKSILGRIERLAVSLEVKKMLRLEAATSRRKEDIRQEQITFYSLLPLLLLPLLSSPPPPPQKKSRRKEDIHVRQNNNNFHME